MDGRMSNPDSSLNDVLGDEDKTEWQDRLVDDSDTPEESVLHFDEKAFQLGLLNNALDVLTEREREIFIHRRMNEDKTTLGDLGQLFQISPERVRQIEHSVFLKIQKIVTAEHNRIEAMTSA